MRKFLVFCLFAFVASAPSFAANSDQLGNVHFPSRCSATTQAAIDKGVALLHSFQYKQSQQVFAEAAKQDPKCAVAYWGQAMALYHQLWDFPSDKSLKEGSKAIQRAKKLHPAGAEEKGFLEAAAAFFQNKKLTQSERRKAYSQAMQALYNAFPNDVEAASFYALSLTAIAEAEGADSSENREKAIAILTPLLTQYPDHPGVAHYLIHAADTPALAPKGLAAARRYAQIAPDSSHALHMPSHIFVRLGMWQDSIASNVPAAASGAHAAEMHMAEAHYQAHALDFLNYSYLQTGQEAKARQAAAQMQHLAGASETEAATRKSYVDASTAIELHRWKEAAALPVPAIPEDRLQATLRARAFGKARSGDGAGARDELKKLVSSNSSSRKADRRAGYQTSADKPSDVTEVEAWIALAEGKGDDAVSGLRDVADKEDKAGVDSVSMPAREMLADLLLELKRPAEALAEYKTALQNSPNRFDSLYGAAHAAQASGDAEAARQYFTKLLENCPSDADRLELVEAKAYLARNGESAH